MNHFVQFFETMQSDAGGCEPEAGSGGFGQRNALMIRLFV